MYSLLYIHLSSIVSMIVSNPLYVTGVVYPKMDGDISSGPEPGI